MRQELYIEGEKVNAEFKIRGCLSETGKLSSVLVTIEGVTWEYKRMAIDIGDLGGPLSLEEMMKRFAGDGTMKIYLDGPIHPWN